MTDKPEESRHDRDLVLAALESRRAQDPEPPGESALDDMTLDDMTLDDMTLAAYLDGKLGEAERDRVEAILAGNSEAAELWLAAREELPATSAPDHVVRRAQGLVVPITVSSGETSPGRATLGAWLDELAEIFAPRLGTLPRAVGAAFAVLALVVVSASGFELGRSGHGSLFGSAAQAEWADEDFGEPGGEFL